MQKISPFLWFDRNAEEAMNFYTSVFKDSKIISKQYYPKGTPMPEGTLMVGVFELFGMQFQVMNAGPHFKFNEAISFVVDCADQAEVDEYWNALTADGGQESLCGWLKDKFGLSWQIIPRKLTQLMGDKNRKKAEGVMHAMMKMRKIEVAELQEAYDNA